jgi:hypothetical protein
MNIMVPVGMRAMLIGVTFAGGVAFCNNSWADMASERAAKSIYKVYDNGDMISMGCQGDKNQVCVLKAKIDGIQRKFTVDFAAHGYVPTLESIRMVGQSSKPWAFAADIAIDCDERIDTLLPKEAYRATCLVDLDFNGAGEVVWGAAYVTGELIPVPLAERRLGHP